MSDKKSSVLIDQIIEAKDKTAAIKVLNTTLELLHFTSDYTTLVALKDELDDFQKRQLQLIKEVNKLNFPVEYSEIHLYRQHFNFLYAEISSSLSFKVNQLKILWGDDKKTELRAEIISSLQETMKDDKGKKPSFSSLKDIYGKDDSYKEWHNLASMSYGLYKNLESLLESTRMYIDLLSSQEKHALILLQKDPK